MFPSQGRSMSSLSERLRAMLDEAGEEVASLDSRRHELAAERDAKIAAIRTEYAEKLDAIDAELSTVRRLERALETPEERRKYAHRKVPEETAVQTATSRRFRPRDEILRSILAAIETGHETVAEMAEVIEFSRGSIEAGIPHLRDDGFVRLAGTRKADGSNVPARTYKITPAGVEFLNANRTPNGAHAALETS